MMDTSKLKKFAQYARRSLMDQVASRMKLVLEKESAARREYPKAVAELEQQIKETSHDQVVEKVAYTWFNRFCALRFMDVNGYTKIRIVSPEEGQFQPAILAEAKMGHIDSTIVPDEVQQKVFALLDGSTSSDNPQGEAYRLLLVAACNYYHRSMSYLFERIADYTELLIPNDLLSGNAILSYVQQAMTPDACMDVEIIGWLYQFYISEKKDQVFDELKKNKKITPEKIPAATQLFTPHYIVRYLVENSLGRLWMLNNPDSKLIEKMDYYIKPVETETEFLKIASPEELKICDPACGSGHMLSYAYDLLYAIYLEQGYDETDIPGKILTHNLFGIELDERAGELASFALSMKASGGNPYDPDSSNHRRFFRKPVQPNICILQNVEIQPTELSEYMDFAGRKLFTADLQTTIRQFDEADNFGSLIQPACNGVTELRNELAKLDMTGQLLLGEVHKKVLLALKQADYLSSKYHVVVANPPYMGGKGMNDRLKKFAGDNYKNSKADLFAMFIERSLELVQKQGLVGMITMQSWMFLSSFELFRAKLLEQNTLLSMAHLGTRGFDSIGGEVVSTTAFVLRQQNIKNFQGCYLRLINGNSEAEKDATLRKAIHDPGCDYSYYISAAHFRKIPGTPIAYWGTKREFSLFDKEKVDSSASVPVGIFTCDNGRFVRLWHEVSHLDTNTNCPNTEEAIKSEVKWVGFNKGGGSRRWYGNKDYLIRFEHGGRDIMELRESKGQSYSLPGYDYYFNEGVTWSQTAGTSFACRIHDKGSIHDTAGPTLFSGCNNWFLAYLNSKPAITLLGMINPTLHFQAGDVRKLPAAVKEESHSQILLLAKNLLQGFRLDWDSYETSWDFSFSPLLDPVYHKETLKVTYQKLRSHWQDMTTEMQKLEQENNRIFIRDCALQDELTSDVPLDEITLTCNPHYRYGSDKSEEKQEELLLADTMREFLSYAVGCMFGRYSLDTPGLILANQGDTLEEYLKQVPQPSFMPDDDNVIPILEESWFNDDIVDRFHSFLKVTFGEEHFTENLAFIEKTIGKDLRKFFIKDFYTDHLKRYKKRPIYWQFSSPKGSFNALVYMHRYRQDTVSLVLDYLREFGSKLEDEKKRQEQISISVNASASDKTKALRQIDKLNKTIEEVNEYERDVLFPLATRKIEIDLDDGVKHNYPLFGKALKKVTGLN